MVSALTCQCPLGLLMAASLLIPLGLLRPLQRWFNSHRLHLKHHRQLRVTAQCLRALLKWRCRSSLSGGAEMLRVGQYRLLPERLGWCDQGQVGQRLLATPLEGQAHQYTRALSCTAGPSVFPSTSEGKTCPCENGQHHSGGLHQPSGWTEVPPPPPYGTGAPFLRSGTSSVSMRSTHT